MSLNLNRRSKGMAYTAMLAVFLTAGLSGCEQVSREGALQEEVVDEVNVGIFYSPRGAVAPDGLDEITSETTQDEVINILGPRYQRIHHPQQEKYPPIQDVFIYEENKVTKYIDVWYTKDGVEYVSYGYERSQGIE